MNTDRINCTLPSDLMSSHILQTNEVKNIIVGAVIGREVVEEYWPKPTKWKSGVVYVAEKSKNTPPILVEVQHTLDDKFIHRVVHYCQEINDEYGTPPVVLVFATSECKSQIMNKTTKTKAKPYFFKLPCFPWASQCFILNKDSISSHTNQSPLDPIVALGVFFTEQKQALVNHVYNRDSTIQQLYSIFQNKAAKTSHLVSVIDDAESRFSTAIDMLEDAQDTNAKKRAIDCLKEGLVSLQKGKRQCTFGRSSSPPSSESATLQQILPPVPSSSASNAITIDENNENWRYIDSYMEQIKGDRMNWQACYDEGCDKGYFKNYSTCASLKSAYNRWKKRSINAEES